MPHNPPMYPVTPKSPTTPATWGPLFFVGAGL